MSNIIGTTISVKRFFANEDTSIPFGAESPIHTLSINRKYIIPYYQREIRWETQNLLSLISDISSGSKFIGNVILSSLPNSLYYEIVDGQQRITSLLMLIQFFRDNTIWSKSFENCLFEIESFEGFGRLYEESFNFSNLSEAEESQIENSDDYDQRSRYIELFNIIKKYFLDKTRDDLSRFYENLMRSEINLILSTSADDVGMSLFLDVNLKAMPLDAEDIFKGYFFKNANDIEIAKMEWGKLKKEYNRFKKKVEKKTGSCKYSLIIMLEHYIRSTLYIENEAYSDIEFSADFKLEKEILQQSLIGHSFAGDHLLEVIKDSVYTSKVINGTIKFLEFINNIVENTAFNDIFKNQFICISGTIDNDTAAIFFSEIKKIILGEHNIPKAFLVKYFISTINGAPKDKKQYKNLHTAFLLGVLFAVLVAGERKQLKEFEPMLRSSEDEWCATAMEKIKNYFDETEFTEKVLLTKLRISKPESNHEYLAKAIAAIYNFYKIEDGRIKITNERQARAFFESKELFSVEHFLINKSGKIKVANENETYIVKYPKEIKRAKDSIFNFIFISEEMNDKLNCYTVNTKMEKIGDIDELKCEFTKMYLRKLQNLDDDKIPYFNNLVENEDDAKRKVEIFYEEKFIQNYKEFVEEIFYEVKRKLISE